jgi:hypothetical protein
MKAKTPGNYSKGVTMINNWFPGVFVLFALVAALFLGGHHIISEEQAKGFEPIEATISEIHSAIRSGEITCFELVKTYLKRIKTYDQPTRLNAVVIINGNALIRARTTWMLLSIPPGTIHQGK